MHQHERSQKIILNNEVLLLLLLFESQLYICFGVDEIEIGKHRSGTEKNYPYDIALKLHI